MEDFRSKSLNNCQSDPVDTAFFNLIHSIDISIYYSYSTLWTTQKQSKFLTYRPTKRGIEIPFSVNQPGIHDSGESGRVEIVRTRTINKSGSWAIIMNIAVLNARLLVLIEDFTHDTLISAPNLHNTLNRRWILMDLKPRMTRRWM